MEQQVWHLIFPRSVALVLHQHAKVIQDTQILLDDVLLGGSGIVRGQDVQLLGRFSHLEHELEQSNRGLTGCRG